MGKSFKKIFYSLLFSSSLFLSSCDSSNNEKNIKLAEANIERISNNEVKIIRSFESKSGLIGFIIDRKNSDGSNKQIVYATPNGEYIIATSKVLNSNGVDITAEEFNKYGEPIKKLQNDIKNIVYIEEGKDSAKHKIYAILDPNCSICHYAYDNFQKDIKNGDLQVRWILIGLFKDSSLKKAEIILSSANPLESLRENELNFDINKEEGGIDTNARINLGAKNIVERNNEFFSSNNFTGTPVFLFNDMKGEFKVIKGYPGNNFYKQASNIWS